MTDKTPLLRVAPPSACNGATVQQHLPDATAPASPAPCCAVAFPTACNTQQQRSDAPQTAPTAICCTVAQVGSATTQQQPIGATGRATTAQRPSLKTLARKVLDAQQAVQQARNNAPDGVADVQPRNELLQQQRTRLLTAARAAQVPEHVIAELPDSEIPGCELLTDPGIRRFAQICLENWLVARGVLILHPTAPEIDLARYRATDPDSPRPRGTTP